MFHSSPQIVQNALKASIDFFVPVLPSLPFLLQTSSLPLLNPSPQDRRPVKSGLLGSHYARRFVWNAVVVDLQSETASCLAYKLWADRTMLATVWAVRLRLWVIEASETVSGWGKWDCEWCHINRHKINFEGRTVALSYQSSDIHTRHFIAIL